MSRVRLGIVTSAAVVVLTPALLAQGVAFQPVVGSLPSGPILNTTPAVSIDRRYVRLGINAQFIDNAAFSTFVVPGAVSGGPSGPGALGGVGLGGAGGAGRRSEGAQFLAGMNGVIDPSMGYDPAGFPPGAAFMGYPFPYEWPRGGRDDAGRISGPAPGPATDRGGKNPRNAGATRRAAAQRHAHRHAASQPDLPPENASSLLAFVPGSSR